MLEWTCLRDRMLLGNDNAWSLIIIFLLQTTDNTFYQEVVPLFTIRHLFLSLQDNNGS